MKTNSQGDVPDYLSLLQVKGRGFVVLGAGQGIGRQVSHALSQAGAKVFCVDRDISLAQSIAEEVNGFPFSADITRRSDVERIFRAAKQELGTLNGIVDIVGVATVKPLALFDDAAWTAQFDIVLLHAFLALQIGGAALAAEGGGTITFVGSMSGSRAVRDQVAYGTSKAALHHLVRSAALEFAQRKVRINAVSPGFIRTPRLAQKISAEHWRLIDNSVPLGRAADPAEIAGPILFLASDLSSHMTGQVINVDGGVANSAALPEFSIGGA